MLRGGLTLEIGFAILLIAPILLYVFISVIEKRREAGHSYEAYVDGEPNKRSNIILAVFLAAVVVMVIIACVMTPV